MNLAQGRFWRVDLVKGSETVSIGLLRENLPEEAKDLRDFRIDVPLEKWNRVAKHARSDRKLLGGVVLDFVKQQDNLATVLGNDRLYGELQRVLLDGSATLVESGTLTLTVARAGT